MEDVANYMMWMQTIMIGVNSVVLLLIAGSTIKWVMFNEEKKERA